MQIFVILFYLFLIILEYICITLIRLDMEIPEKTYFETHAEEMLRNAGMNKAQFSERMGIARQNVLKLFETKNIFTLMKAATILKAPLSILIYGNDSGDGHAIDGFVEVDGKVHRIRSREDIESLLGLVSD